MGLRSQGPVNEGQLPHEGRPATKSASLALLVDLARRVIPWKAIPNDGMSMSLRKKFHEPKLERLQTIRVYR